jgi:hypothetical protein
VQEDEAKSGPSNFAISSSPVIGTPPKIEVRVYYGGDGRLTEQKLSLSKYR